MICPCFIRFTPTHVGKRDTLIKSQVTIAVHPHARGEKLTPLATDSPIGGSPPRTWGKGRWPWRTGPRRSVHPHARGEKGLVAGAAPQDPGSPPRTWGNGVQALKKIRRNRFTPTHVGKRSCQFPERFHRSVHPHARGEKPSEIIVDSRKRGSPPRTWGKVDAVHVPRVAVRFTPTHVGKRRFSSA